MQVVTIYHNVERDHAGHLAGFFGYEPEHAVTPVFVYADEVEGPCDPRALAEHAYERRHAGHRGRFRCPRFLSAGPSRILSIFKI